MNLPKNYIKPDPSENEVVIELGGKCGIILAQKKTNLYLGDLLSRYQPAYLLEIMIGLTTTLYAVHANKMIVIAINTASLAPALSPVRTRARLTNARGFTKYET
jgi:hypothetical protein